LRGTVQTFNVPATVDNEKTCFDSNDVLSLAREVIQYASKMIIDVLAEAEQLPNAVLEEAFSDAVEKMLAVYMTPGCLSRSKENIRLVVQDINHCSTI